MSDRLMPPALFKATIDSAVMALAKAKPLGFKVTDVAAAIGCGEVSPSVRKSIRQRLKTLCNRRRLFSPHWGLYLATDETRADIQAAINPVLVADLKQAFFDAGGFMAMPDILRAVGYSDPGAAKRVRTVLSESAMFDRFIPLKGMRDHWRLSDSERAAVPVPGRWMIADLQLMVFRMAGGRISWKWGLKDALDAYRLRVGSGLKDARLLWRLSPEEIVSDDLIASALDNSFSRASDLQYFDPNYPDVTAYTVAEWWGDCKEGMGAANALAESWRMLEGDGGHPYLLNALDVATWAAIGAKTKLDPALLSRGAVAFDWRGP